MIFDEWYRDIFRKVDFKAIINLIQTTDNNSDRRYYQ